jgi:hypothetical protein
MKHLLPILTLALLGATTTAFAADFYYDYYQNPIDGGVKVNTAAIGGRTNESDSFTYGTWDNVEGNNQSNDFTVRRELNWDGSFKWAGVNNNFFYIQADGSNKEKMTLYLTDFVKSVVPQGTLKFNSDSNALFNMGIDEVGYRVLSYDPETGKYSASSSTPTDSFKLIENEGTENERLSSRVTPIDSVEYYPGSEEVVTRYKYKLGNFDPGNIVEVYMKDKAGNEVFSFSSFEGEDGFVPFDNTNNATNTATAQGGFGDGGYRAAQIQTDAMLHNYYFEDTLTDVNNQSVANADYEDYKMFLQEFLDEDGNNIIYTEKLPDEAAAKKLAAQRAQPLSQLIPGNVATAAVAFGIYAVASGIAPDGGSGSGNINGGGAFGQPLPGGVQLALIAGLFGLGFCYIRRRKVIVG